MLNRLTSGTYDVFNGTGYTATNRYKVNGITYDLNGNILTMRRYRGSAATVVDRLTYAYGAANNRLGSLTDSLATASISWDAESGSFTYDANGNALTTPAPYSVTAATYDYRNLPLSMTKGGVTTTFRYDEAGQRFYKLAAGTDEYYLRDGSATLAVWNGSALAYWNLLSPSGTVIGRYVGGAREYYVTDHLGSVRVALKENGGTPTTWTDYDPWGMEMEDRSNAGSVLVDQTYTGHEKDTETGLLYAGARYLAPAYGRWMGVDPAGEYASSYVYVGNNPVQLTDPTGFCSEHPSDGIRWHYGHCGEIIADRGDTFKSLEKFLGDHDSAFRIYQRLVAKYSSGLLDKNGAVKPGASVGMVGVSQSEGLEDVFFQTGILFVPVPKFGVLRWLSKIPLFPAMVGEEGASGLASLTIAEIKQAIGSSQTVLLRQLFGRGVKGAEAALERGTVPDGLTRESLELYAELAKRIINEGSDHQGVQALRLKIIDKVLNSTK